MSPSLILGSSGASLISLLCWISLGLLLFLPFLSMEYLFQQFLRKEDVGKRIFETLQVCKYLHSIFALNNVAQYRIYENSQNSAWHIVSDRSFAFIIIKKLSLEIIFFQCYCEKSKGILIPGALCGGLFSALEVTGFSLRISRPLPSSPTVPLGQVHFHPWH